MGVIKALLKIIVAPIVIFIILIIAVILLIKIRKSRKEKEAELEANAFRPPPLMQWNTEPTPFSPDTVPQFPTPAYVSPYANIGPYANKPYENPAHGPQ